jgi:CubicO group peptidase (beta-lactamase class C family)
LPLLLISTGSAATLIWLYSAVLSSARAAQRALLTPARNVALFAFLLISMAGCRSARPASIHGTVAPGFEGVRTAFAKNFRDRGEVGAAVAVMYRGEMVVDLWGGERNPQHEPWEQNTLVPVYSTTKGIGALVLSVAHSRGWLHYDSSVARYWPEFAQQGKQDITVRQLLSHEAGLVLLDQPVPLELVNNLDALAVVLARQKPKWEPGTQHGYHLSTLGFYMNELFRRVEPSHRTIGAFLRDDIATAAKVEFYIGLPDSIPVGRVAHVQTISPWGGMLHAFAPPFPVLLRMMWPRTTMSKTMGIPRGFDVNDERWWRTEIVSGLGISSARDIARLYGLFATGGGALNMAPATIALLEAPPRIPPKGARDAVVGVDMFLSLGFMKPAPALDWGSNSRAYGMPGAGGSFGFADPEQQMGYAYVMNRMGYHLDNDPREQALRKAVYTAIAKLPAISALRGDK